jgi:16S rRNA (cytosine1402-N4)-methyltransferase
LIPNEFHTPVLVESVLHYLQPAPGGVYVDGTVGGGGHAEQILMKSSPSGKVIGFDMDSDAIAFARKRLERFGDRVTLIRDNVANIGKQLADAGFGRLNGMLLDLGVSSHQIGSPARGFSFQQADRIDMRMDRNNPVDGWKVINTYSQERLAEIFWKFGEERAARRIAKLLVQRREIKPIDTTEELAGLIRQIGRGGNPQQSLARVFQAIRLEVNNEMENLPRALAGGLECLDFGGRLVVISYHSLEDRIVKSFFREESKTTVPSGTKLLPDRPAVPGLKVLTKKPVVPSPGEIAINSRSRSAKLRAAERI